MFGPVFRYFDVFDVIDDFHFFSDLPRVAAWRGALAARPSVRQAVSPDYPMLLSTFLWNCRSALSARMTGPAAANPLPMTPSPLGSPA